MYGSEGKNYWWVAPIYGQAEIAFRRLVKALPLGTYKKNEAKLTITLANGALIWFKSADNPDSLYGEDVYAAVIDEASRVKADSWFALRSTLTATRGKIRAIGNVKGKRNWFWRMCRRAESGMKGHHFARLSAYDAVEGGVLVADEIEQAKNDLPEEIFRELYLALAAEDAGAFFKTDKIRIVEEVPKHVRKARGWDFAATEFKAGKNPDWTAGVLLGHTEEMTYVMDVCRIRKSPEDVLASVLKSSYEDKAETDVVIEEERGSSGKIAIESIRQHLGQFEFAGKVHNSPVSGDKSTRAFPFAVRVNRGEVCLVKGPWNEAFLAELDDFPPDSGHDDQVDAASHAFNFLAPNTRSRVRFLDDED